MKKKLFFYVFFVMFVVFVTGCTKYIQVPYQVNNTIYSTTIIQNHTIEYVNVSTPCDCSYNTTDLGDPKYILGLIQQIKRCEDNIIRHWNLTECVWEIEKLNKSLANCNESLNEIKELLD